LVGRVYRNKDGSQPAEPVKKILAQLDGSDDLTLAEWAELKKSGQKSNAKRRGKPKRDVVAIDDVLEQLQRANTHEELRDRTACLTLDAAEWKALSKNLTGRSAKSGKAAREAVETYLSDKLLLNERVSSVKRLFR
jgi:hypothetical protein